MLGRYLLGLVAVAIAPSSDQPKCGLVAKGTWHIRSLLNPLPMKPR
jgi:hypothetical protein